MPAAAEDHFWRIPFVGALVSLLTGAFPFARSGCTGLERAERLLARGKNVLLFPEGTRSTDGSVAEFHRGVGKLATNGTTIVPIAVSGTGKVLPKGSTRPRTAPVTVTFGAGRRYEGTADDNSRRIRDAVVDLGVPAPASETASTRHFDVLRHFAGSRTALALLVLWAFCEAIAWPLIPDLLIVPLALGAPRRWPSFVACALVGSVAGGLTAYTIGVTSLGPAMMDLVPLVTDRMVDSAGSSLEGDGVAAVLGQPLSGIPYKVFAYQASSAGGGVLTFLAATALGRGLRFLAVGAVAGMAGRWLRPVWERFAFGALALYFAAFIVGLARVVHAWS
jgi:membrane protein YqaA with SNARE-associated domain